MPTSPAWRIAGRKKSVDYIQDSVDVMTPLYNRFRSDISRADFTALSAIVAIEKGVEQNNAACGRFRVSSTLHSARSGFAAVSQGHLVNRSP
jgi:hypothetical protein